MFTNLFCFKIFKCVAIYIGLEMAQWLVNVSNKKQHLTSNYSGLAKHV